MPKYLVLVEVSEEIEVEADNKWEAEEAAKQMFDATANDPYTCVVEYLEDEYDCST